LKVEAVAAADAVAKEEADPMSVMERTASEPLEDGTMTTTVGHVDYI
jgi:hypothetical protein